MLLHRVDWSRLLRKTWGDGLCMYINKVWCTNSSIISSHCSEAVEYMTLKCRPYYLPSVLTAVFIVVVYISQAQKLGRRLKNYMTTCALSKTSTRLQSMWFLEILTMSVWQTLPQVFTNISQLQPGEIIPWIVRTKIDMEPTEQSLFTTLESLIITPLCLFPPIALLWRQRNQYKSQSQCAQ